VGIAYTHHSNGGRLVPEERLAIAVARAEVRARVKVAKEAAATPC
jgi:hypothetical protein